MAKKAPFPYVRTFFAWFLALLIFFPLFWLGITAFKTDVFATSARARVA